MVETFGGTKLHVGDIVVIVGYFAFVLFVGLWTSRQNRGSAGGYFLAGRNMHWIPVGASLFASNIGSLHFVGLAGSGAAAGISIANYELNAMLVLVLLAYIFLPVYIASGIFTMPQYLQRRFGGQRIQIFLSVLTLLMYIFTKISADLYAGIIFIEQSLNWDMYGAVSLLLGIAAIFTITGGLTAVIWTDLIQTIIMLVGATVLMIRAFVEVGGFNAMVEKYPNAIPESLLKSNGTCGYPRDDFMHLFRDPLSSDLPWPGILGLTINSIWYWCSDQVIVQRALAAKNFTHAKCGTLLCGFMKVLPLFMLVFPGMIARILFKDTVGCADPLECEKICGSSKGCTNIAYPTLVIELLPAGARGIMLAVMLAALMSSLTSIFNSSSTIFAMDIWTHIRKKASELEVMIVGRVFVIVLVLVSIIWIPVLKASQGTQLYVYVQEVASFLQPPICAIFVLGIFWERLNEKGAFFGLLIGFVTGIIRFAIQYSFKTPDCGSPEPDPTPIMVKNFHYLYFSIFLCALTALSAAVISLITKPLDSRCLQRLTWQTRNSNKKRLNIEDWLAGRTDSVKDIVEEEMNKVLANDGLTSMALSEDSKEVMELKENKYEPDQRVEYKVSCPRHVCNWIWGIDSASRAHLVNQKMDECDMISIEELPKYRILTGILSGVLISTAVFLYGFFH
ncbi:sodium/myo-inositol cotransporter 2 [Biomphalaria pfeifferi]|uniref:Sodium/myo-inositol cotransporter 2 n=1 Tax=Biomphalaria pfeifferi TaxID=112525 RepID=A0AAD8C3B7_BIOPF|nr:sodium/myo-inositol cotransporter 2 [Biomphalaria pfeifferi]